MTTAFVQYQPPVIQNTAEISTNVAIKAVLYGGAGIGKTRQVLTVPEPIILSAEEGLMSVRGANIPFTRISTMEHVLNFYQWCLRDPAARRFHTVYMDSVSEIAEVCLNSEKAKNKDPRKAYGEAQDRMIDIIRSFRDMATHHVVMVAKMERIKDEMTGALLYGPMFPGQKLPQQVPYFFDEVFYLYDYKDPATQQTTQWIKTRANAQFIAKDRSGNLLEDEPANLGRIFHKIQTGQ